ncbi:hypothetical protein ACFL6E_02850 [Candidatus Neomarinimicrobiota bacterium]
MLIESAKRTLIEKIIQSDEFANSTVYGKYLTYLFNASIQNTPLKETTIAMDVFGKGSDFNPAEDTIVRSHTYNLRKKIEHYNLTEGRSERYRPVIPKGHYEIQFEEVSMERKSRQMMTKIFPYRYQALVTIFLLSVIGYLYINNIIVHRALQKYHVLAPGNFVWKEFLESDLPVMIVPGNHYVFNIESDVFERALTVRDVQVNSIEDYEAFKAQFPEQDIGLANEPYFPYHSIWGLPPILSVLFSANKKPILRKSSDINPQVLDEYDLIFTGSIKTLYSLNYLLPRSHFKYEIIPHRITYTPSDNGQQQNFETSEHSPGPNEDLVLVLKLPGPANNTNLLIASYSSMGVPEIAKYLTDDISLAKLENHFQKELGHVPEYFEILFRVQGIDKTAYKSEILICGEIQGD